MTPLEKTEVELRVTEEAPPSRTDNEELDRPRFPESLIVLAKHKSFILKFVSVVAVLSIATVLVLPKTYTASTKILPPQQSQSMGAMAALSQLGPMAALAGQNLGLRNPNDLYVAMLRSDTVANDLIDRFFLMSVYREKLRENTRKKLAGTTEIRMGPKDGVITISVEDRSPQRATDLANGYVEELEKLTKTLAVSEAARRRIFFEREMKSASEDLAAAEVALKETQQKTGLILLDSQAKAMIESLSSLRARIAAQEVMIRSMRSFASPENPDLALAEQQLAAMQEQLSRLERGQGKRSIADVPIENVPTAGLEYVRKYREMKYREALFELLAKQYEAARIDEAKDATLIQVLDKATLPERRSWPPRTALVLLSAFLAFIVAVIIASAIERMEQAKEDPQFASQFRLFRLYLGSQRKS